MRLSFTITSPNTTINIPKEPPTGEWTKFEVIKIYHNANTAATSTNKAFFFNIGECSNTGYITASSGKLVNYAYAYLLSHGGYSFEKLRLYDDPYFINFLNKKTDKLTISIVNAEGDAPTGDISTTRYMLIEIDIQ